MTIFAEEPALLPAFRRGDRPALEAVYWRYVAGVERVVRYGFRLALKDVRVPGADEHAIADLVQEVFARAFTERARLGYDGLRAYGPYLLQIARNLLVDRARRSSRERVVDLPEAQLEALLGEEGEPDAGWASTEDIAATQAYIAGLSPELRGVHEQRFVLGRSQRDAAEELGLSRQQLRTREDKLCDGLRDALKKRSTRMAP